MLSAPDSPLGALACAHSGYEPTAHNRNFGNMPIGDRPGKRSWKIGARMARCGELPVPGDAAELIDRVIRDLARTFAGYGTVGRADEGFVLGAGNSHRHRM